MSGGVDSSVVAAMLKADGYECIGFYLNLWADPTQFSSEESKNSLKINVVRLHQ